MSRNANSDGKWTESDWAMTSHLATLHNYPLGKVQILEGCKWTIYQNNFSASDKAIKVPWQSAWFIKIFTKIILYTVARVYVAFLELHYQSFVLHFRLLYHSICRRITDVVDEVEQQTYGSYLGKGTLLSTMLNNTFRFTWNETKGCSTPQCYAQVLCENFATLLVLCKETSMKN